MKSDNLVQLSGFLTKDVITNEKEVFRSLCKLPLSLVNQHSHLILAA